MASISRTNNIGLLIIRLVIGAAFMYYGYPIIIGGMAKWTSVGMSMRSIGVGYVPAFFGFLIGMSQLVGGFLILTGVFFRPACVFTGFSMFIIALTKFSGIGGLLPALHYIELLAISIGFIFTGPGTFALYRIVVKFIRK